MMHSLSKFSGIISVVVILGAFAWAGENAKPVYIPSGTVIEVRIIESLTSAKAQPGDTFHATLVDGLFLDGKELFPRGADVLGRVMSAHSSGRLSDPGELALEITEISYHGQTTPVRVQPWTLKGESHTKSNVTKIGGGAALGAIIGAIAGGGKGAAIGAGVGTAAGTGVAAGTGKKDATVESEAILSFTVSEGTETSVAPLTPASETSRNYGESKDADLRQFSLRDRRVIRNCYSKDSSSQPQATSGRGENAEKLRKGDILPAGLEKRVQPLPEACERELSRLPNDQERAVYERRVLLLDADRRILDIFDLDAPE